MSTAEDEVSIQFSGGSDSTLTAVLMCGRFRRIHLLTFVHSLVAGVDKAVFSVRKLEQKFGKNKFVHKVIDCEKLFKSIYYGTYMSDLKRYKTFLNACWCFACRLAMHTLTIIYDLQNGIYFARDGSNVSGYDPCQTEWILRKIKEFYEEYGINYANPVYNVPRTDWRLFELGISTKENVKFPYEHHTASTTQGTCNGGLFHNIYLRNYYLPLYGRTAYEQVSTGYLKEKVEFCRKYISHQLNTQRGNRRLIGGMN